MDVERRERRWAARDARTGAVVAYHVRIDSEDGAKRIWWEDTEGNRQLPEGIKVTDLALYNIQNIQGAVEILIVEGEKCADALISEGIPAVGTICGASTCPSDDALRAVVQFARIVLWSDNDIAGRRQMSDIARRLHALGATNLRIVNWADAPEKGDCADAVDQNVDVRQLINQADPIPPPPPLAELLDDLVRYVGRFLVLSLQQRDAVALWIAHTYIFHNADCTPYLNVFSADKRSGKSLLLEILELLVANPWFTGRATVAVLARKIDQEKPTLLLDETDAAFKSNREYAEALRGIMNTGFRAGGSHSVCVGQGANISYRDLETYCPKAIAGIGRLPGTVADRSVDFQMKRKTRAEKVERFRRKRTKPDADVLREALAMWAETTQCYDVDVPLPEELDDRAQDIWEVLFQIAEEAGGDWAGRARAAALGLAVGIEEDDSLGILLLTDIRRVFEEKGIDRLPSKVLAETLIEMEESPWGDIDGKSLDARKLASFLKPYGIGPITQRMGADKKATKGYLRSDFEDAWSRYVPLNGNNGNKTRGKPNSCLNRVIDGSDDGPSKRPLLPTVGRTVSSVSGVQTPDVTDVTDEDVGMGEIWKEEL